MSCIRGYSEFRSSLSGDNRLRLGLMVDSSVLISATDDADSGNSKATEFLDVVIEEKTPIFCNVVVRSEFLQKHRRIILSEVLFEFATKADRSKLRPEIARTFDKWLKLAPNNESPLPKLRLNETPLKEIKRLLMGEIADDGREVWTAICRDLVGTKLGTAWETADDEFGLNFLSTRDPVLSAILPLEPQWEDAVRIIEKVGIGSSDAMILNMFFTSELHAIATSDFEFAHAVQFLRPDRVCFVPDKSVKELRDFHERDSKDLHHSAEKVMRANDRTFRRLSK